MSKERLEMLKAKRLLQRSNSKILSLFAAPSPKPGFEAAIGSLCDDLSEDGRSLVIGGRQFGHVQFEGPLATFLPHPWKQALRAVRSGYPGCEGWKAGFPLIAMIEIRMGTAPGGYLKLNAELGPIAAPRVRKGMVEALQQAASAARLDRIQFQPEATARGQLYSRFFHRSTLSVGDVHDVKEIRQAFMQLIEDFGQEVDLVTSVIPEFSRLYGDP